MPCRVWTQEGELRTDVFGSSRVIFRVQPSESSSRSRDISWEAAATASLVYCIESTEGLEGIGASGRIRTCGLWLRRFRASPLLTYEEAARVLADRGRYPHVVRVGQPLHPSCVDRRHAPRSRELDAGFRQVAPDGSLAH